MGSVVRVCVATFLFFVHLASADCQVKALRNSGVEMLNPDESYMDYKDGTIIDLNTGLMWQKCVFGGVYNVTKDACIGGSGVPLKKMHLAVRSSTIAGYKDWRVPTLSEIYTLIEPACSSPSINQKFDAPYDRAYWTSPLNKEFSIKNESAVAVDFTSGQWKLPSGKIEHYLRLVRGSRN